MTKVKVKNFQSVKNAEFDIDGFTVIIGKNNIGKSALVRAIDAALTNRTGSEFIRLGEKQTEVSIDHGKLKIQWKKGSKASYKVNEEPYSALNRSVPQPLIDAGFKKIELNNIKLSPLLASQFKPLFLIDETGSAVTEALSNIYKLDLPSRADDLCQKELRSSKSLLKTRKQDLKDVEKNLETFKDFENIKFEFEKLKNLDKKATVIRNELQELEGFQKELLLTSQALKEIKPILGIEVPSLSTAKEYIEKINTIIQWEKEFNDLRVSVEKDEKIRPELEIINKIEQRVPSIKRAIDELGNIKTYHDEFRNTALSAKEDRDNLNEAQKSLDDYEKQKSEIKSCPLCKRPF